MKEHLSWNNYDSFYYMKDINYSLNNPLETRKVPMHELNLKDVWASRRISRNALYNFN